MSMEKATNKRSLLDNFTSSVLMGRSNAIFYAVLFSLLPYFSFLSVVTAALVTLRQGAKEGLYVIMAVMLPVLAMAAYYGEIGLGIERGLFTLGLAWLLCLTLRLTRSWSSVLTVVVVLAGVAGGIFCLLNPNHITESKVAMQAMLTVLQEQGIDSIDVTALQSNIDWLAEYLLGVQLVIAALVSLTNVAFARYLQSRAFNPGGFSNEWLHLRLSRTNLILFLFAALSLYFDEPYNKALVLVSALPLVVSGLSLVHWRVRRWASGRLLILLPCYFFMIAFMPFSFVPLMVIASADVWYNFRNFQPHTHVC